MQTDEQRADVLTAKLYECQQENERLTDRVRWSATRIAYLEAQIKVLRERRNNEEG